MKSHKSVTEMEIKAILLPWPQALRLDLVEVALEVLL